MKDSIYMAREYSSRARDILPINYTISSDDSERTLKRRRTDTVSRGETSNDNHTYKENVHTSSSISSKENLDHNNFSNDKENIDNATIPHSKKTKSSAMIGTYFQNQLNYLVSALQHEFVHFVTEHNFSPLFQSIFSNYF